MAALARYSRHNEITHRLEVVSVDGLEKVNITACDVIIARGYTARRLRELSPDTLVIEMHISGYDVLRSIQECQRTLQPKCIGFVGFYSAFNGIEQFCGMFGCQIRVYIPAHFQDIDAAINQAVAAGCDVIIGGYSVYMQAKARGLNAFVVRSGEEAFGSALEEAVRAVELVRQERVKTRMHQIIIQSARMGILYVDAHACIQVDNKAARMIGGGPLRGKTLQQTFPCMEDCFKEAMGNAREFLGELRQAGDITISLDCLPVVVDGQTAGVVINFQNITKVQQLEGQIRKKLSVKGLVARHHFEDIIHRSALIDETLENARRYAHASANILIVGETGTGKELFAQSIHNESPRRDGPFVAVNCGALPENLLESELFGYVEGAFTGTARGGKMGLFELAHNGTLFLDEISEIAIGVQSKLLRALQEREVRRIGDDKVIAVNVRIISSTNKNLYKLVAAGLFRQDLLYRLDVLKVFLPPLSRREDDVVALFYHFLQNFAQRRHEPVPTVEEPVLHLLRAYRFIGNARELRNIVERVGVLRRHPNTLTREDMERALYPEDLDSSGTVCTAQQQANTTRDMIRQALADCQGNQTRAARLLGVNRTTLWRKLRQYGLQSS